MAVGYLMAPLNLSTIRSKQSLKTQMVSDILTGLEIKYCIQLIRMFLLPISK
jgi:hypothetical protein